MSWLAYTAKMKVATTKKFIITHNLLRSIIFLKRLHLHCTVIHYHYNKHGVNYYTVHLLHLSDQVAYLCFQFQKPRGNTIFIMPGKYICWLDLGLERCVYFV